jgi:manganese/zinc/iron transport system substrate-binding protein
MRAGLAALMALASVHLEAHAQPTAPRTEPFKIVATVSMVGDIVRNVAGKHATVTGLMGEGVDPHLYKPTRDDIVKLQAADIVFYSGLLLEGRMTDTLLRISQRGTKVHAVTGALDKKYILEPPGFAGHADPHVWMDVQAWSQTVQIVAAALGSFDPAHSNDYAANATVLQAELRSLDDYARKSIATIPVKQRVLITAHDAFNYFGRAYGIKVMGIQGISTESEAGVEDINRTVKFITENQIPAIFVESSVSDKNVRAIIEGAKSRGWTLKIGGTLFSDATGKPGSYEGTYIGMIDHNVTTITRALGGDAPESGLRGKLGRPAKHE